MNDQKSPATWILPLLAVLMLTAAFTAESFAQTVSNGCESWQSTVDPKVPVKKDSTKPPSPINADIVGIEPAIPSLSESDFFDAIDCLLQLKGRKYDSRIVGATRADTSQTFGASSVEIAGLYYVSYLFYQNWGHSGAAVLLDNSPTRSTNETVSVAYDAYRIWAAEVRRVGLAEARKRKLDPLQGTNIRWY